MALAEVSVIPIGTPTSSIGDWVAKSVKATKKSRVKYELGPMCTVLEGKLPEILAAAKKMHETAFNNGIKRAITTVVIDDRRDKEVTLKSKIASLKKRL